MIKFNKFLVCIICVFGSGFLAEWIFTDIPQWAIGLHAFAGGILALCLFDPPPTSSEIRKVAETAYEAGWITSARWAQEEHLIADIGSPTYTDDMNAALSKVRL